MASPQRQRRAGIRPGISDGSPPGAEVQGGRGLLTVQGLSAGYGAGASSATVVDDVSFTIGSGEVIGVVGESGSGKSTLASAIMGVMPTGGRRLGGTIEFKGEDLASLTDAQLRQLRGNDLGFIPQNPMSALNPVLTIGQQLGEAIDVHQDVSAQDREALIAEALDAVGIPDGGAKIRNYPHELSGGMRQRVLIAMSIINRPSLLIADEPTTALDVTIQAQILDLLKDIIAERGMSMLLITHDMGVIASMCDRVLVMYAGEVVEEGSTTGVFKEQRHPYSAALLRSAGDPDPATGRFEAIAGSPAAATDDHHGCRFRPRCRFAIDQCETRPSLLPVMPGHASRCWVAQEGDFDDRHG